MGQFKTNKFNNLTLDSVYLKSFMVHLFKKHYLKKRNSKIPKGQTEIVKAEDRQDHGQQNETKDKHRTHNTTLKTKAGVTRRVPLVEQELLTLPEHLNSPWFL